jgi:hypothetical protein
MNKRNEELAKQCTAQEFSDCTGGFETFDKEKFAELIRADEREACAKLIESRKTGANELMDAVRDMEARAIRARGQA